MSESDRKRNELASLWQTTAARIRGFVWRIIGDLDVANEVLSRTFLEAARSWDGYTGKGSRQAWLFGIAGNLARHERRRRSRWKLVPLIEDRTYAEDFGSGPDEDDVAVMWKAIKDLPDHLREAIILRLENEMSYSQIAEALDIPIGTVRSRLHEAVRRLREGVGRSIKE